MGTFGQFKKISILVPTYWCLTLRFVLNTFWTKDTHHGMMFFCQGKLFLSILILMFLQLEINTIVKCIFIKLQPHILFFFFMRVVKMVSCILSMELFYEIKFNLHKNCLGPKKLQKCILSIRYHQVKLQIIAIIDISSKSL